MDYKEKYLKYKSKYLQLKGGSNKFNLKESSYDFIRELKKLYSSLKYDDTNLNDKYKGHNITYDEMDYNGFDDVIDYLSKHSFDCFIDIGSGRGKICIYAGKIPSIKQSIGIELVKERHDDANKLKTELNHHPEVSKVNLINDDIFNYDLKKLNSSKTLVWLSNLVFEQKTTNDIFTKILNESKNDTVIVCSKPHTLNNDRIKKIGQVEVQMSPNNTSLVHCYRIN